MESQTEPLVERDAELDVLERRVRAARAARGGLVTIEGPAGIGKTRLLRAGREMGERGGGRVLGARGSELERGFPYGLVRQLLEAQLARLTREDREQLLSGPASLAAPVFDYGLPERGPPGADPSFALLNGLFWLVGNLARRAPLVLTVDDVQWSDEPSLRYLAFLARRLEGLAVLLVVTARTGDRDDAPELSALMADPLAERLRPSPLSGLGTARLVRGALGDEAPDEFCLACHDATGGNPFLLRELLGELAREGVEPSLAEAVSLRDRGPRTVSRAVLARVRALGSEAEALVRAAAVLGDDADARRAAALAELEPAEAAATAAALADASILERTVPLRFVHPTVRAAIYNDLPPAERINGHARAARALREDGAPDEQVAAHLLAMPGADSGWVVDTLRDAARAALARGSPDGSVAYLHRALAEPPPPEMRGDVLRELGLAELRLGRTSAIEHLEEALELTPDPRPRAETARALTTVLVMAGRAGSALAVIDGVVSGLGADREAHELDAELTAQAWFLLAHADPDVALREAALARLARFAAVPGATPAERLALGTLAFARARDAESAHDAARLVEHGLAGGRLLADQGPEPSLFYGLVNTLLATDRLDLAEESLREALRAAQVRGAAQSWVPDVWLSHLMHFQGRMADSERGARTGLEQLDVFGWPAPVPWVLSYLVDALRERGRPKEAERALEARGLTGQIDPGMLSDFLLAARGRLRIAQGRHAEGAEDLLEFGRRADVWGALHPNALRHRSHAAIGLAGLGELDEARRLAAEDLEAARRWGTARAVGIALRAQAALEPGEHGIDLLEQAVAVLERSLARLELAHALV